MHVDLLTVGYYLFCGRVGAVACEHAGKSSMAFSAAAVRYWGAGRGCGPQHRSK